MGSRDGDSNDGAIFRVEMRRGHLTLFGEMDSSTASVFLDAVDHLLERGSRSVDVNLAGLTFLDAAGVRAIFEAQCRADEKGVFLWVHQPSRPARRIMELIGAREQFSMATGEQGAGSPTRAIRWPERPASTADDGQRPVVGTP
jgi:anti-sigma B factor antagonist